MLPSPSSLELKDKNLCWIDRAKKDNWDRMVKSSQDVRRNLSLFLMFFNRSCSSSASRQSHSLSVGQIPCWWYSRRFSFSRRERSEKVEISLESRRWCSCWMPCLGFHNQREESVCRSFKRSRTNDNRHRCALLKDSFLASRVAIWVTLRLSARRVANIFKLFPINPGWRRHC